MLLGKQLVTLALAAGTALAVLVAQASTDPKPGPAVAKTAPAQAVATGAHDYAAPAEEKKSTSTADHSKFKELQKNFKDGPEVTKACLTCHTEAAKQVHKSKHWTWEFLNPETKQRLGKKNVINNFCTAVQSNYEFCTACHVGYGWKDDKFDFTSQDNVDCVVCHETTGTYRKLPGLAGHPALQGYGVPAPFRQDREGADAEGRGPERGQNQARELRRLPLLRRRRRCGEARRPGQLAWPTPASTWTCTWTRMG